MGPFIIPHRFLILPGGGLKSKRLWSCLPVFILLLLANGSLSARQERIKIACIGNSITYGYTLPDPAAQSYPARLQKKLGNHYEVRNFGHSGATLTKKGYNPYYKTGEFTEALDFRPDMAIICLGINDTDPRTWPNYKDDFIPDYNWLIDTLRATNPAMKVFVCSLMPVFTGHPRFLSSTLAWSREAQEKIRQVATINHTGFIDLYAAFHNRPDLITDAWTLHPNVRGAERLCKIVYEHLTGNFGGLQVADIFTDNMVWPRDRPVTIWGTANADTRVSVSFDGERKDTGVAPDGKWAVTFPAMQASLVPHIVHIRNEEKEVVFKNILIGDVWLCSGQSNMYFSLKEATGGEQAAKEADPKDIIRLFKYVPVAGTGNIPWDTATLVKANELDFFHGTWKLNEETAAKEFSAVGYWFGKTIRQEEGVPVGLIELATGGSPLISWLDRPALEEDPLFEPALHDWRHSDYIMKWCRERADVNLEYAASPYQRHPYDPCYNFEAGVAKITLFPIKGVIWYQGESDADNPGLYEKLFPLLVKDWRSRWGYEFPFYFVQLSGLDRASWPHFRDAQRRLLESVPRTGMAVSSDLGDRSNVHYPNKKPVGLRLAGLALYDAYNDKKEVPHGPLVKSVVAKGSTVEVFFSQDKGLTTADGQPLRGFEILDNKGYFVKVTASIHQNKVVVEIPENTSADKVVYGWQPFTTANLVNGAGLPASTFMMEVNP